jgi:hypothetical protein
MGIKTKNLLQLASTVDFLINRTILGMFFDNVDIIGDNSDYARLNYDNSFRYTKIKKRLCIQINQNSNNAIIEYDDRTIGISIFDLVRIMNMEFKDFENKLLLCSKPNEWSEFKEVINET